MNKCINCDKTVSRKEYKRCNNCNKNFRALHKKEHNCISCGIGLKNFYAERCEECWHKFMTEENNPNHRHGRSYNNKCKCGKLIYTDSISCMNCYGKIISKKLKDRIFTEEHRKNIGLAHKDIIVSKETRIKLSLVHGGTGIPYEHRKYPWAFYLIRKIILKRDNYTCQKCNKKGNTVHHIDYNKMNCKEKNLITLCRRCNLDVNFKKDFWKNIFQNKIIILTENGGIIKNG